MESKTNLGMIVNFFFLFLLLYSRIESNAYLSFISIFGIIISLVIGLNQVNLRFGEKWD